MEGLTTALATAVTSAASDISSLLTTIGPTIVGVAVLGVGIRVVIKYIKSLRSAA